MCTMNSVMALKDHLIFEYVYGNKFFGMSKDKIFAFKMSVDFQGSGVDLIKRMQIGADLENSWTMFNRVSNYGYTRVHQGICANSTQTSMQGLQGRKNNDEAKTKYHVIHLWWLSFGAATEEGFIGLTEWLEFWHFSYRQ